MMKDGLAYRKRATLNWCDECQTVLANEQVNRDGTCFIHDHTPVKQKELDQWFFAITRYAEELLEGHKELAGGWPENILEMQRNWIGRSEGAELTFPLADGGAGITVFTTRPDTLYGATFMSMAPEHPMTMESPQVRAREGGPRVRRAGRPAEPGGSHRGGDGEGGVFTAATASTRDGGRIPCTPRTSSCTNTAPGRSWRFPPRPARLRVREEVRLPIVVVVQPEGEPLDGATMPAAHEGPGRLVRSGGFDGLAKKRGRRR
jgi:leucyl-tRNA synthetase